jgi:hypothetical protein
MPGSAIGSAADSGSAGSGFEPQLGINMPV